MSLKYKDPDTGEWVYAGSVRGPAGKSAYEYAKDGGFTGTEADFSKKLADDTTNANFYSSLYAAMADINSGTFENALNSVTDAKVKVTTFNGKLILELMGDLTETQIVTYSKNVETRLCGHELQMAAGTHLGFTNDTNCAIYGGVDSASGNRGRITGTAAAIGAVTTIAANGASLLIDGVDLSMSGAATGGMYTVNMGKPGLYVKLSKCNITASNTSPTGTNVRAVCLTTNSDNSDRLIEINECTINAFAEHASVAGVHSNDNAVILNSTIDAVSAADGIAYGVLHEGNGSLSVDTCEVHARSDSYAEEAGAFGVYSEGTAEIINSTITSVYSGETVGTGAVAVLNALSGTLRVKNSECFGDARHGNTPSTYSIGVRNCGIAYLDNCTVTGTHSGCSNPGPKLYVSGGTYTGNWHGGFYFSQDPDGIAYVNDVHTRDCVYEGEFPETNVINSANCWGAIYVGGDTDRSNITVCMDGCTFEGYKHAIAMRGSLGEVNNTVNLSNCTFLPRKYGDELCTINYHNNTHHVNVGIGCNITAAQIYTDQNVTIVDGMLNFTGKLYRKVALDKRLTGRDYDALAGFRHQENATDGVYFDISADGIISLKPEYRGEVPAAAASNAKYATGVSDRGADLVGTQNHELPEEIIIPETVNGIVVKSYCYAMFMGNKRIKKLVLPASIKEISGHFCFGTWNLREVHGTESVEVICVSAFSSSGVLTANFPSLKRLDGKNHFHSCADLVTAELGNVITAIPEGCFYGCERLAVLRNANAVTTVGKNGFRDTRRLKTLSFLSNLTSIGDYGFFNSRVAYAWETLPNFNKFGVLATPADLYDAYYWSGCTFTPKSVPVRSTFSQLDPRWADKTIGNTSATYSCVVISMAMAYSALMGMELSRPEEFIEMVFAADPSLKELDPEQEAEVAVVKYMTAAGFDTTWHPATEDNFLQTAYDGLADGAVLIQHCMSTTAGNGHARFVYGVNADGEMLFADPTAVSLKLGRYEASLHPQPPQNRMAVPQLDGHPMDGFWIIKKKS